MESETRDLERDLDSDMSDKWLMADDTHRVRAEEEGAVLGG